MHPSKVASEVIANNFDTSCSTHPYTACPPPLLGCRVSGPKSMSFKKSLSGFSNRKFSNLWATKRATNRIQGNDSDIGICFLINIRKSKSFDGFCVNFNQQICEPANFLVQPSQIWGPNLISRCTTPIPVTKGIGKTSFEVTWHLGQWPTHVTASPSHHGCNSLPTASVEPWRLASWR